MAGVTPTFRSLVTSFTDFLTVVIHTILYERSIYPATSFLSARKYNFPVRQNRHPKVCEWINDAVAAVEAELLKSTAERVAVIIYDKSNTPRERFVFDVSRFPIVAASELDTTLERVGENGEKEAVLPVVDMEEQFRGALSKISNCSTFLQQLPSGCTFTVAIELREDGEPPIGHPQPWVPVQPREPDTQRQNTNKKTTPIRAIAAGEMTFETWIEEATPG